MTEPSLAARAEEIQKWVSRERADIVHLSGHGDKSGYLQLNSATDTAEGLSPENLQLMFRLWNEDGKNKCVMLNVCFSSVAARSLAASHAVPVAIGLTAAVGDKAAIIFATHFYSRLADGQSVHKSFESARLQIKMSQMPGVSGDWLLYELHHAPGIDIEKSIFEL